MLLVCPNCSKKYKMTAEQLGDVGRNVECSSCHHVWFSTASDLVAPQDTKPKAPITPPVPEEQNISENLGSQEAKNQGEAIITSEMKTDKTADIHKDTHAGKHMADTDPPFTEKTQPKEASIPQQAPSQPKAEMPAQAMSSAQENEAVKHTVTPISPISPIAPQAVKPLSVKPQPIMPQPPKPSEQSQVNIAQTSQFNDDLKMFNEGADLFEKVEHSSFAAKPSPEPSTETEAQPKTEPQPEPTPAATTHPEIIADKPQSVVASESEAKTTAAVKTEDQAIETHNPQKMAAAPEQNTIVHDTPVKEAPTEQKKTAMEKPTHFAEPELASPKIQAKKPFFTPENMGSHAERSSVNKLPQPPKFTEEESSPAKNASEKTTVTSETIVQNLPVIVKQDVNNELKDALIRSQQLNSRLSFMIFANMLLLTGILILLLLKS